MKALILFFTFAFVATLHAQTLAPELEPLAAKHTTDQAAFDAQKGAAMIHAQQTYISALDGAEKTATSAGTLDAVAAITREREALKSGQMPSSFPNGLPKALQAPRKSCLDAMARIGTDFAPRQKAMDADSFRALSSLQTKAVGKPELAQQIAAEKEKLLANAEGEDLAKHIENLLTSTEWIARGGFRYKFFKGGKYQHENRTGRYVIDGKTGFVSFFWDNKDHPGEGLQYHKDTGKFEHNKVGDFDPVGK